MQFYAFFVSIYWNALQRPILCQTTNWIKSKYVSQSMRNCFKICFKKKGAMKMGARPNTAINKWNKKFPSLLLLLRLLNCLDCHSARIRRPICPTANNSHAFRCDDVSYRNRFNCARRIQFNAHICRVEWVLSCSPGTDVFLSEFDILVKGVLFALHLFLKHYFL